MMKCNKSEGCTSDCWHKNEHETIIECGFPCPIYLNAVCTETTEGGN
jgi:hypothetical protein